MKLFDFPLFPEQASTLAKEVDDIYFFALAISAFFSLLIAVVIFYLFVRFRRRSDDETGTPLEEGRTAKLLEITWSIIPLAITMVMFAWGAKVFFHSFTPPADAKEYLATGKQWMWKFQHPDGQREINSLHVPVGERIKLTMTSEDVIHSFFVPAFRVKRDVLPGRYSTVWFEATKPGTYHLFCAEYCGAEHSRMLGSVTVMEKDAYQAWLAGIEVGQPPAASGEELFAQLVCNTCHYEDSGARGPSLTGIYGTEVELANGQRVMVDDNYLRESILRPNAKLVAGYQPLMPTYQGQINETGLMQLIAYIKSLAKTETSPTAQDVADNVGSNGSLEGQPR